MALAASALVWILALGASAPPAVPQPAPAPTPTPTPTPAHAGDLPRILVFSRTAEFRHKSIPVGVQTIREIGAKLFDVDATEDAAAFTPGNLKNYRAVVFLSTTGDVLNPEQQGAFEAYIRAGHGYAGVHAAADTEYDWPWYGQLVGAFFKGHPKQQQATVKVEDHTHPSTRTLPDTWVRFDEWYSFRTNPRASTHVLASLDETTYDAGELAMGDHPIAWYHDFDGGRAWYTALGHTDDSFREPLFRMHLREGILWAAGLPEATATPVPAAPATPAPPATPAAPKSPATASMFALPSFALPSLTLAAIPTAITLAGAILIMVVILGAMGQGVRAPLLAWLWPGLGHLSLGYRRRATLAMFGVLGMFVTGVLVGGVDAVDSREDAAWFIAQAGNGPLAFGADALNQGVLKSGTVGELIDAPPPLNGSQRTMGDTKISSYKGIGAANEFGTLFIALGGLMNLILVMDCARREPAAAAAD